MNKLLNIVDAGIEFIYEADNDGIHYLILTITSKPNMFEFNQQVLKITIHNSSNDPS